MDSLHLGKLLRENGKRFGHRPALGLMQHGQRVQVSFSELLQQVRNWAGFLHEHGVGEGDRVAFITPKSPNQIRAFHACWWLGAVAVPISETLGDLEAGFIIRDCDPTLILVDTALKSRIQATAPDLPVVTFDDLPLNREHANTPDLLLLPDTSTATLIYTSGSTGMPKGVTLTHRNLYTNAEAIATIFHIGQHETIISLLPYWHSLALVGEVVLPLMTGLRVAIAQDKRDFARNLGAYQPTILLVVPRIAQAIMGAIRKKADANPSWRRKLFSAAMDSAATLLAPGPGTIARLRARLLHCGLYKPLVFRPIRAQFGGKLNFMVCGGAPLSLDTQLFFQCLGIPIYQGYGLTEASPVVSVNTPAANRIGSCGTMLPWLRPESGGDYTFRDDNGHTGKCLHGELLLRGDCVMKGYWRHADDTANTLSGNWLHTGDTGHIDPDGYLFLEGRLGNMIVLANGEKLHPEPIEEAIQAADLIAGAMLVGDGFKNVYACVCLDPDNSGGLPADQLEGLVKQQVRECTDHLAAYQRPRDVLILPLFTVGNGTLTVTEKIRRHTIWDKYGDRIDAFLEPYRPDSPTISSH